MSPHQSGGRHNTKGVIRIRKSKDRQTMAKRKKINIATDECESHHVCRRVLFFSFLCCRYEGEGQGMKQTFEC